MSLRGHALKLRPCVLAIALALGLGLDLPASAINEPSENAQLAALIRQLDLLDRLAHQSAQVSSTAGRYHFDYARLHADIARMRVGIQDYLSPPRAQPRDAEMLSGEYRRDERAKP